MPTTPPTTPPATTVTPPTPPATTTTGTRPPVVPPAASASPSRPPAPGPSTQPRGFMDKVGDFFGGLLNNFTGNNPSGTGMGAIIGTAGLGIVGYMMGGIPGALIGAGAGVAGGGLLNDIALQVMDWIGIPKPTPPSMTNNIPPALPDNQLATTQQLGVNVPGVSSPVVTSTIVPKSDAFKDLERLSVPLEQYRRQYGAGMNNLGAGITNRLNRVRTEVSPMNRSTEMQQIFDDQTHIIQFMNNTRRWNQLAGDWQANERPRLVDANTRASAGLALPELGVPNATDVIHEPANQFGVLPDRLLNEAMRGYAPAGVPVEGRREQFLKDNPDAMQQLKVLYTRVDNRLNDINGNFNGLVAAAKEKSSRSWTRRAQGGYSLIRSAFGESDASIAEVGSAGRVNEMSINGAGDAVHAIARINELPAGAMSLADRNNNIRRAARAGLNYGDVNNEQRALFQAAIERADLEDLRHQADQHFSSYAQTAEQGYNRLVQGGAFQRYTQEVETLRAGVDQRNVRVQELNQAQLRFVERSPAPAGPSAPPQTQAWVTVQDDSVSPPKVQTLVAEKRGDNWVVTHAYNGRHDAAKDTAADTAIPPMQMPDVFTAQGVMSTNNIGNVLRQSLVQMRAANPALGIGTAVTPTVGASTPAVAPPVVTPPGATPPGAAPAPGSVGIE